jgi:hypothetical protein
MGEAIEPDSADAADSAAATFQRDFRRPGLAVRHRGSTGTAALKSASRRWRPAGDDVVVPFTLVVTASARC